MALLYKPQRSRPLDTGLLQASCAGQSLQHSLLDMGSQPQQADIEMTCICAISDFEREGLLTQQTPAGRQCQPWLPT